MGSKEKEKDGNAAALVFVFGIVALSVGIPLFAEMGWPRLHGATPAQLMDEPLSKTPKQLASDLPATTKSTSSVTVRFKKGTAGEYEKAEYTWDSARPDAPYSLRLRADRGEKTSDAIAALSRHFHGLDDGRHRWGPVTIRARDDGDLSFEIDRQVDGKPNPLFDRQIEAAKQVILNAAFNLPLRVTDREIADVLGAGYSPSVVAKFDVTTPVERAAAALREAMPATLASGSSSFKVPLDHPLVTYARLTWVNRAHGALSGVYLSPGKRYAGNRSTFEACIEKKLGPPKVNVTDYAGGKKDFSFAVGALGLRLSENSLDVTSTGPIDGDSFARLFQTLDACRDAGDTSSGTR